MQTWLFLAYGRADDGAGPELRRSLAELLSAPQFGCDHSHLDMGPGSSGPVHVPADERIAEPAVA